MKFIICLILSFSAFAQDNFDVLSPNGKIKTTLTLDQGRISYQIKKNNTQIVKPSRLGVMVKNIADLSQNLELIKSTKINNNKTWTQPWGESKTVVDHYNGVILELKHPSNILMNIEFKVFNDGVGFRYLWPKQERTGFDLEDDLSEFRFSADDEIWWIPAFQDNRYEYLFKKNRLSDIHVIHTPTTLELKNGYTVAIHEARLIDFASMALKSDKQGTLRADLVPWADGTDVKLSLPHQSPWRTMIIADKHKDLVESTLMLNLNDPSVIKDTSWIDTGKYIGIWWAMHLTSWSWESGPNHGATTANTKAYIDFAAEHGFRGVLVEGWNVGWNGDWTTNGHLFIFNKSYPDFDVKYLSDYAKSKGVAIIGHHETGSATKNYENQLDSAFNFLNKYGMKVVKTGYVGTRHDKKEWHHGQSAVRHYTKVMEHAAQTKTMLVVHEPIKPTGLQRTYPNLMASEGARGQEYDAWSSDGGNPPDHTTILPFTRILAGPMDFTPGTFSLFYDEKPNNRVNTTLAKQLALYVVIYSPWQMASDLPENYLKHPEAFEFIKKVPTNWENTIALDSKIGDYAVIARQERDSKNWYLGAITDENGRKITIDLKFLPTGWYKVNAYQDARDTSWTTNPYAMDIYSTRVHSSGSYDLYLAPGGGLALEIIKE